MNIIAASIRGDLASVRKPITDVCEEMDMSPMTWSRRMKDPYSFTARELRVLHKYIKTDTFHLIIPKERREQ